MPVLAEELTITVAEADPRRPVRRREVSAVGHRAARAHADAREPARRTLVAQLAETVRARGQSARVASMAMLVADELISNAVHNAPVDASGDALPQGHRRATSSSSSTSATQRPAALGLRCALSRDRGHRSVRQPRSRHDPRGRSPRTTSASPAAAPAWASRSATARATTWSSIWPRQAHRDHRADRCPLSADRARRRFRRTTCSWSEAVMRDRRPHDDRDRRRSARARAARSTRPPACTSCSRARTGGRLVLDLGGITFINSLGVRDWIRMQAAATQQAHRSRAAPGRRVDRSPAQHDHRDPRHRAA